MTKLKVKKSCFKSIENVSKVEIKRDENHKELVKESNAKIAKAQARQAKAYFNARNYLGD
ncbi:MAG: hypothetical protein IKV59_02960 [Lachnospiraceae bacterium]|nr:hypothetical protein [Lachnospiraceae bacterium]